MSNAFFSIFVLLFDSIFSAIMAFSNLKKRVIITSTNNTSFNFNSKYFFEYLLHDKSVDFDFFFLVNDDEKRNLLGNIYGDKYFVESKTISGKIFSLLTSVWVSSTLELPMYSLYNNPSRIVLHLGHGIPLKKIGLSESNISKLQYINRFIRTRSFTHVVCYSDEFKSEMESVFENKNISYLSLGQPRNDYLNIAPQLAREKIIGLFDCLNGREHFCLYAPTWRPYKDTMAFPFEDLNIYLLNDFLKKNNIKIFIRAHPFYPLIFPDGFEYSENILDLSSSCVSDIIDVLPAFDSLLTDYSSIYLDFLCLNKKIAFIPYDLSCYEEKVGFSLDYVSVTPGRKIFSQSELLEFFTEEDVFYDARLELSDLFNIKNEGNCREISSFINSCI